MTDGRLDKLARAAIECVASNPGGSDHRKLAEALVQAGYGNEVVALYRTYPGFMAELAGRRDAPPLPQRAERAQTARSGYGMRCPACGSPAFGNVPLVCFGSVAHPHAPTMMACESLEPARGA